jgi:hypothetical protein
MSLETNIYNLQFHKVILPPLPYSVKLGFSRLHNTLKSSEAKDLLGKYPLDFNSLEKRIPNKKELNNFRWLMTPWMSYLEPFDKPMAVCLPFTFEFIFAHESFRKKYIDSKTNMINAQAFIPSEIIQKERILHATRLILKRVYGEEISIKPQMILIYNEHKINLPVYYGFTFDESFVEVEILKDKPPKLDKKKLNELKNNPNSSIEEWLELVPVDCFSFKGFSLISTSDVTIQQSLAGINRELQKGSLIDMARLSHLQTYLQIFTRAPELKMRIYVPRKDDVFLVSPKENENQGCMVSNSIKIPNSKFNKTCFFEVLERGEQVWCENPTHLTQSIMNTYKINIHGTCLLIPLYENKKAIGLLELALKNKEQLIQKNAFVFAEMIDSINQALQRGINDLQQKIQNIIQANCTALHSSVVWRFEEEARKFLENKKNANFSEIVFNKVYPLYSQSDIQSSSYFRNESIKADLNLQLDMAAAALKAMHKDQSMPIYKEMIFQIEEHQRRLTGELHSSDELAIQQFLMNDVEKIFNEFGKEGQNSFNAIKGYREKLDNQYGMIHLERGRYERTVTQINTNIIDIIEKEQLSAQEMIPHYSEKTSTDGVELSMYLGKSLLYDASWSDLHLRNLRLWQLILTCKIARYCDQTVPDLELPLLMTHLILVQDMPLTIRFSTEEKEFTVDGAYNIRYAIMKKRIDKATIVGTKGERLTQPGMVAVVYSHSTEADMYLGFFKYLQSITLIGEKIEDLELESLQGLSGLKALRVQVLPDRRTISRGPEPDIAKNLLVN